MPYPEWKDSLAVGVLIVAAAMLAVLFAEGAAALRRETNRYGEQHVSGVEDIPLRPYPKARFGIGRTCEKTVTLISTSMVFVNSAADLVVCRRVGAFLVRLICAIPGLTLLIGHTRGQGRYLTRTAMAETIFSRSRR